MVQRSQVVGATGLKSTEVGLCTSVHVGSLCITVVNGVD